MDISIDQAVNASDILSIIKSHPEGLKEYDLLMALYEPLPEGQRPNISDSLTLFQQHFWLFHTLYSLRDQQHALAQGHLVIDPLSIRWLPYDHVNSTEGGRSISGDDPLRHYYLNLDNLRSTGRSEVDDLLASFWVRVVDKSDVSSALELLGMSEEADLVSVKRRYRQLLSEAHPDKGGCHQQTQALNEAMSVLKRHYK